MSEGVSDREILNVFREQHPEEETLTTADLERELPIEKRAIQGRVKQLNRENRLTIETEGRPNQWKLSDTEPTDPVYDPRLGKAKRWANEASEFGRFTFLISVGVLAAVGIITSNHIFAEAVNLYLPLIDTETASFATLVGVGGSVVFGLSALCFVVALTLPHAVKWYIEDSVSE
ncbi:hypothetical protein [Halovenus sp. HT40]|uniref:hypothetical protein n=1 Tax=Halovenus sp. HT40 TaxID=3126691 RepID=UPI00300EA350